MTFFGGTHLSLKRIVIRERRSRPSHPLCTLKMGKLSLSWQEAVGLLIHLTTGSCDLFQGSQGALWFPCPLPSVPL